MRRTTPVAVLAAALLSLTACAGGAGGAVLHADACLGLTQRRGVDLDVGRAYVDAPAGRARRQRGGEQRREQQLPHAGPWVVTSFSASIGSIGPMP